MNNIKISILTPSYNSSSFIEIAIQSVIDQNYPNFEHIIVDGKSSDGTVEILQKHPHLIWVSEKDKGQSDAMNKAFRMATGEVIVYLNADDYFESGTFNIVDIFFRTNKNYDILVGNLYNKFIDQPFKIFITTPEVHFKKIILPFKYAFPYNPVSYFYKRKVQATIGEFPEDNHLAMDYWFLIRAFDKFKVYKVNQVFGTFFRTGYNKTSLSSENQTFSLAYEYCKVKGNGFKAYYGLNYVLHQVFQLPMILKEKIKYFFYLAIFANKIDYTTFKEKGFKKSYKSIYKNWS